MSRFAIRSLHLWDSEWRPPQAAETDRIYEERIVIVDASSHAEALKRGWAEAEHYAKSNKMRFLDRVDAYEIDEDTNEVFSELRLSKFDPSMYKEDFYRDKDAYKSIIEREGN